MSLKSTVAIAFAALLILPQAGIAKKSRSASSSSSASSSVSSSDGLAGVMGFAADSLPSAASSAAGGFSAPNALGGRYWVNDDLGIDVALAIANSSATGASNSFGLGGGVVYNLKRPSKYVYIQALGRFSFLAGSQSTGGTSVNTSTLGLYGGVGFEAFIPAWPQLSVSGGMGLQVVSTSGSGSSVTGIDTTNYGSTPVQVAIHYYLD